MPDFNARFPDVRVNMGVRTGTFPIADSHFEAAIHYGKPTWPGTSADFLFREEGVPVCSKTLLSRPVRKAADLLDYPLLHSTTRPESWAAWFANLGIDDARTMQGVRYELHTMLIAAAAAGLGIAMVPRFFLAGLFEPLNLMIPFDAPMIAEAAYYLVYPTELSHSKPLANFRGWLLEQAAQYQQQNPVIAGADRAA
jgi:DNA-binding transcriptional LysR family regulator